MEFDWMNMMKPFTYSAGDLGMPAGGGGVTTDAGSVGTPGAGEGTPPTEERTGLEAQSPEYLASLGLEFRPDGAEPPTPRTPPGAEGEPQGAPTSPEARELAQIRQDFGAMKQAMEAKSQMVDTFMPLVETLHALPPEKLEQVIGILRDDGEAPAEQEIPQVWEPEFQDPLVGLIQTVVQQAVAPLTQGLERFREAQTMAGEDSEYSGYRQTHPDVTDDIYNNEIRLIGAGMEQVTGKHIPLSAAHDVWNRMQTRIRAGVEGPARAAGAQDRRSLESREVLGGGVGKPTGPSPDYSRPWTLDEGIADMAARRGGRT